MDLRTGILQTAQALGIDPLDLATVISYETGGTFDPTKRGPTTQWGQHRGLIQFGEPQARQYGVDWNDPLGSQLGPDGAVAKYLRGSGLKPGMGMLDLYSTINAGAPGLYERSDANNGGAPGTVRDKVEQQMSGHRQKAAALLGQEWTPTHAGPAPQQPATGGQPMRAPMVTTQGEMPPEDQPKGLLGFLTPDRRDRLIMGLEGMTLNPNQALMAQAGQGIADRRKLAADEKSRNATAEWLRSQGAGAIAEGVASGALSGRDGLSMYQTHQAQLSSAAQDPMVQSAQALPDQSGVVTIMKDGSVQVRTAGNEVLSGQAAVDYVRQAQERNVQYQQDVYGARREGTLGADVELGGAAAAAEKAGGEMVTRAFDAFDKAQNVAQSISTIDEAIAAIDGGAQSGMVYNMLPSVTEASASLENAMNRMGLDVIGSVTFGALSEGEMKLAMETAVPRNLAPADLKSWLVRKRDAQVKAREALMNAARYFSQPGNTLEGWLSQQEVKRPSSAASAAAPAPAPSAAPPKRIRMDAEGNIIE